MPLPLSTLKEGFAHIHENGPHAEEHGDREGEHGSDASEQSSGKENRNEFVHAPAYPEIGNVSSPAGEETVGTRRQPDLSAGPLSFDYRPVTNLANRSPVVGEASNRSAKSSAVLRSQWGKAV